ncbi:large ribosomal subunit protein uL3m [Prorops nasuta]|uniref:large ribosomal subunit protein uL3m n=1 Tax=Prorops nasuta TaxID=863751 RepID=UPI0034CD5677
MATLFKPLGELFQTLVKPCVNVISIRQVRTKGTPINKLPRKRYPVWLPRQHRVLYPENLTQESREFIQEYIQDKYSDKTNPDSPLKDAPIEPQAEWTPKSRRTGLIVKKIGIYPMWLKNGKKVSSTLLQVVDNHVVKYIPPCEYKPRIAGSKIKQFGALIVGGDSADPQLFTKEYCNIFEASGVMPTRELHRFSISPNAALQPGTALTAAHYKPGEVVDIRGKTKNRGFQGVMKRWGFHGMPATHGTTKTHRRPGNIGSGGTKARVMPGTKMPGHMGNRYRIARGVKILRINTKYNVIWVLGQHLPGETGNYLMMYDTILPLKKLKSAPNFPTYLPELSEEKLPEELFVENLHVFNEPSIKFTPET